MGQSCTNRVHRVMLLCAVSLSLYLNCFADQGEKKVTLNVVEESCVKVFKQIEKQTKMSFFYSTSDIRLPGKVSINVVNAALDEVMGRILEGTELEWIYTDNVITIRKKKGLVGGGNGMGTVADSNINMITVTGKVTDADGAAIPGATVRVKRTGDGATTDSEGNFILTSTRKNDLLLVSSIGYETRQTPISGGTILIKLNIAVSDLDETIIKGYYSTTKRLNTGSISKVTSRVIESQPVTDPMLALQGRIPGLLISQSSGVPGAIVTVKLRGRNSIANGNNPLYLVDGIPFNSSTLTNGALTGAAALSPFSNLNPMDIESIEVLKDADGTAIYGSRGANGVILITTKKGKTGKQKFDINISTGITQVGRNLKLLQTKEYLSLRREALKNDNTQVQATDYDINGTWDTTRYTDWQKLMIGETGHLTNAQINISGGNTLTNYLVGGNYRSETTVFPGDYRDRKLSAFIRLTNTSPNNKLNNSFMATYVDVNNMMPPYDFTSQIFLAPTAPPIYKDNGELNWENETWENPLAGTLRKSQSSTSNLIGNWTIGYKLFNLIEIKTALGYNHVTSKQNIITPLSSFAPSLSSLTFLRSNSYATTEIKTWNIEPQISLTKKIWEINIDAITGLSLQETKNSSIAHYASDFPNDELIENVLAATYNSISNYTNSVYRYTSLFTRINLNRNDKYILNLTGRRDGSSRFGNRRKYGNYGALGAAWIFTEENFMKPLKAVSYGKIRASYGTTGNDQIPDYQYLSTYSISNSPYLGTSVLYPTRIANPYYGWEEVKKLEFGLELGLFANRLLLTSDYYRNRTENQLVGYSLPAMTGFTSVQYNLPAVLQNSGLEFEVTSTNVNNSNLLWSTSLNISIPSNKLISYPNIEGSTYSTRYEVGKSIFTTKRFKFIGVDPKTGIYQFEDVNKDGTISSPHDLLATKELSQKYFGGLFNSIRYKQFKLDILLQFVKQNGFSDLFYGFPGGVNSNQPETVLKRWVKTGDHTAVQRLTQDFGSETSTALQNFKRSDGIISDASFIRLKNISLSYEIPKRLKEKLHISDSRIYINCQNLMTFTKYNGFDPEVQSLGTLPPVLQLVTGIQLSF